MSFSPFFLNMLTVLGVPCGKIETILTVLGIKLKFLIHVDSFSGSVWQNWNNFNGSWDKTEIFNSSRANCYKSHNSRANITKTEISLVPMMALTDWVNCLLFVLSSFSFPVLEHNWLEFGRDTCMKQYLVFTKLDDRGVYMNFLGPF